MTDKILLNLEILVKQMARTMGQNKEINDAIKDLPPVDFSPLLEKLNEVADRLDKEFPELPAFPEIPPYPKFPDIPKVDLSEVKELLNGIKELLNKQEKPDMSELVVISSLLNKLIETVNAQKKDNFIDKIKVEVSKIFEDNIGITEDQFKEVIDLLKAIKSKPSDGGGGGYKQVAVEDKSAKQINPATQETLESISGFNIPAFDTIEATYPDTVTEVYTYKKETVTVGTITVVYTNSTKEVISSVTKS